tara:strand:- start:579 stop:1205 length:627 start_codon:yes stop_codon:yes gene_type:complete
MKDIDSVIPKNFGWIKAKLDKNEIDYLWKCIDEKGENIKHSLVGQINSSYRIQDKDDWFFNNVLAELGMEYQVKFADLGKKHTYYYRQPSSFYLAKMWVNYQKQYEFNPLHDHTGIYSFVIWMKIPTEYKDQKENSIAMNTNTNVISNFCFNYQSILGGIREYVYEMSKEMEGIILFFPSELKHTVYPFYNCEEDRISISGNIAIKML